MLFTFTKVRKEVHMRVFKKGDNLLETNDAILIRALINSGYEEVIKIVEETEVKTPRKRSKVEEE